MRLTPEGLPCINHEYMIVSKEELPPAYSIRALIAKACAFYGALIRLGAVIRSLRYIRMDVVLCTLRSNLRHLLYLYE